MTIKLSLLSFTLLAATCAFSQKTNFSGNWQFKGQESISGKLYSNAVPKQIKAEQKADVINIEKTSMGQSGDVTSTESVSLSGKPFETVTASKRKKVLTIKWSDDKKSFTETAEIYSLADPKKMDFKTTDTWSLTDGNLLLVRKSENFVNGEVWEAKANYQKQ